MSCWWTRWTPTSPRIWPRPGAVIDHDDVVDDLFLKVKADLIQVIRENPEYGEYAADLLMVNKYLERIGDHATNLAEWVIFALDNKGEGE